MSTYSISAAEVVREYEEAIYRMIDVTIKSNDGRFRNGALTYTVTAWAQDGLPAISARSALADAGSTIIAESFMASLSQDGKEIHAFFTTDAFADVSEPITFEFSYGLPIGAIENVNIHAILTPLPAFLVDLGYPDADNALLDAL